MYRFYIRAYSQNAAGTQSEIAKIQTSVRYIRGDNHIPCTCFILELIARMLLVPSLKLLRYKLQSGESGEITIYHVQVLY